MPGISIELNGVRVATINLAGMDVIDVSVNGALDQSPKAMLEAMGGNYGEGGCGHLIWIAEKSIATSDVLEVKLIENCDISDRGQTIEELYPDQEPCNQTDFTITDEMAAELRERPRLHQAFSVQAETTCGQKAAAISDESSASFTFRVLWNFLHPTLARVHLTTNCLDDVLARKASVIHLDGTLSVGDSALFRLVS
jgi:hypothetical protein